MKKLPIPDENNELKLGIRISTKHLTKLDDEYQVNCIFSLSIGNDLADEKNLDINSEDIKNYLIIDYKMLFEVEDDSVLLDNEAKLVVSEELRTELKIISEPYFKEMVTNIFSRSEFPAPPIPYKFWRKNDGIK